MTTFSIVTVVRDDLGGLKRTAASLDSQTFTDFEWIVIDGMSSGVHCIDSNSLAPRPSIFVSEPDSGIFDAMNKGWKDASGEWVLFLNAGDVLCQPRTLGDVAQDLSRTDASWAFGLVRNVDSSGHVIGIQNASPFHRFGQALGKTTVPHQATFMRRELLSNLNGFRMEFGTAADQELIYRAARLGEPRELVWPIADFQVGGRGMQVPPTRVVTSMRRARREQRDFFLGHVVADAGATTATYVLRAIGPLMEKFQR